MSWQLQEAQQRFSELVRRTLEEGSQVVMSHGKRERVLDILDAIAAIERHPGREKANFERDELLQVWFLRHLQIIGEAARHLPEDVQTLVSG